MERIKERQKASWEGAFYAGQRIDLLIISISSAGIYVSLETIKYIDEKCLSGEWAVKLSAIVLVLGILVNLISQIYGKKANEEDYLYCEEKINSKNQPSPLQQQRIEKYDKRSEKFSKLTYLLTNWSIVIMILGIFFLILYFLFLF